VADAMRAVVKRDGGCELLKGRILANIFYEPSTRTMCSFAAAMMRLGGQVIPVSESSSSSQKGETLSDTIRCLECYADVLVLRHPVKGSVAEAAKVASKPIINAVCATSRAAAARPLSLSRARERTRTATARAPAHARCAARASARLLRATARASTRRRRCLICTPCRRSSADCAG
jgi:carbamoyl-phosphate synthase/aspartate carbamoyltransferase/dihydroorotase